jgi:hypothetical protein
MKKDAKFITKIVKEVKKNDKDGKKRLSLSANNSDNYAQAPKRKYKKRPPFDVSKMGRPKEFPDDHPCWAVILERVTSGMSLSTAIKSDGMPVWSTVQLRIANDEAFRSKYDDAIQTRADLLAEQILDLADETMPEWLEGSGASAWVQQKRLQVDARKWVASKLKPRTYGDRLDVSVSDNRISVLGALEQAQQRVALGMSKEANVLDVEVKKVKETVEVGTPLAERMDARFSE